jgi:hypothetical protein
VDGGGEAEEKSLARHSRFKVFRERLIGAARLDAQVYEDVKADKGALGQATAVVVLPGIAAGIGFIGLQDSPVLSGSSIGGLIGPILAMLTHWFVWAIVVYHIGTKVLREPQTLTDLGELLRTIGFAYSPGVFLVPGVMVLGIVPILGVVVLTLIWIWMQVTTVIAVRQALGFTSTLRAVGVVLLTHVFLNVTAWVVFG